MFFSVNPKEGSFFIICNVYRFELHSIQINEKIEAHLEEFFSLFTECKRFDCLFLSCQRFVLNICPPKSDPSVFTRMSSYRYLCQALFSCLVFGHFYQNLCLVSDSVFQNQILFLASWTRKYL